MFRTIIFCWLLTTPFVAWGEDHPLLKKLQLDGLLGRPYPPVITALAFSASNDAVAAAGDDHAIRILRLPNLELVQVLTGHQDWVRSLDFSPRGDRLVSAGNDGQVLVWNRDAAWSTEPTQLESPAVACARFCPQGIAIGVAGFRSELSVLGNPMGPTKLDCGCSDLRAVAFAPNHPFVVVAGRSGHVHIVGLQEMRLIHAVPAHRARIRQIDFLPGSKTAVSCAEDGTVVAVDVLTGQPVGRALIPGCKLHCLTALDQDRIATGGSDNRVYIIDITLGKILHAWEGHEGSVAALAHCDDVLVSSSYDTTLRIWSLDSLKDSGARVASEAIPDARTSAIPIPTVPAAR